MMWRALMLATTWVVFTLLTFGLWTVPCGPHFTEFGHLATQGGFIALASMFTAVALFSED